MRGALGTGVDEWFTPGEYIALARAVLGDIDLDPASIEQAQEVVQAAQYFTKVDDGLRHDWFGKVWLNPPYARHLIAKFASKMLAELAAGRVAAAIMLTHNYTDTAWFHKLADAASVICFTRGRIEFYADGELANPTQGQTFFYFGKNPKKFARHFRAVGLLVARLRTSGAK